ncbi:L,D-transpeptidase family protein [bacterium]|nr:L,D-transpeptidase family protein [bacterium]
MKKIIKHIFIINILIILMLSVSGCSEYGLDSQNLNNNNSSGGIENSSGNKPDSNTSGNSATSGSQIKGEDNNSDSTGSKTDNELNNNEAANTQKQDNESSSTTSTTLNTIQNTNENTPPKLILEITEGPVILEDNSLCYYRIKAKVKGNPAPQISFSKDDSNGAWGKNISQVNLLAGESYELHVKAENTSGKASASVSLTWNGGTINKGSTSIVADEANPSNYFIEVSLNEQKVRVFYKNNLLKEIICSSGAPQSPTPKGIFKISDKIKYSWLPEYDVGAYYFVRFFNSYLFHSTPFDKKGNLIEEDQQNLGKPVSHGCVRLDLNEAKWLYETVPSGTQVKVY